MTPDELAAIHARAMTMPPPWSARTIAAFLAFPGAVLAAGNDSFALGRVVADEAEILTIAVLPEDRGKGIGRARLAELEHGMRAKGAKRVFLEVAVTNQAATRLYFAAGYAQTGRRSGYYTAADGARVDAILMSKQLDLHDITSEARNGAPEPAK